MHSAHLSRDDVCSLLNISIPLHDSPVNHLVLGLIKSNINELCLRSHPQYI